VTRGSGVGLAPGPALGVTVAVATGPPPEVGVGWRAGGARDVGQAVGAGVGLEHPAGEWQILPETGPPWIPGDWVGDADAATRRTTPNITATAAWRTRASRRQPIELLPHGKHR
jgi:hypothetical protein